MTECKSSEHDWCYENVLLTSYPPQQRRICRKCLKHEIIYTPVCNPHEYYELLNKKKEQGLK
jgi:hypothetical protein